jgi:hypothetical protein
MTDTPRRDLIVQAMGEASMCWEHPEGAGTFDTEAAIIVADKLSDDLVRLNRSPEDLQLEHAMGIISNAMDWDAEGREEWVGAARRWLDEYHTGEPADANTHITVNMDNATATTGTHTIDPLLAKQIAINTYRRRVEDRLRVQQTELNAGWARLKVIDETMENLPDDPGVVVDAAARYDEERRLADKGMRLNWRKYDLERARWVDEVIRQQLANDDRMIDLLEQIVSAF